MGDSDDDYDRKRRDKFRGERSDYREPTSRRPPPDDRRRDDWNDRGNSDWNRNRGGGPPPRQIDYRLGGGPRPNPHEFSPPSKRPRNDWGYNQDNFSSSSSGYGSNYDHPPPPHGGYMAPHPGPPHHHRDDSHGPPSLLSFKAWLSNQDDSISDQDALTKYAEYKQEFKRQQLNEFFVAHRDEEWFKNKYHPDESAKRKEEQNLNLKKRVAIFMEFMEKKRFEGIALDAPHADKLTKLMDWYVIRLEDGSDELAAKLLNDEPRPAVTRPSLSPSKEVRPSEPTKEETKENGTSEEKPAKAGSEDGAASESDEEKADDKEKDSKKMDEEMENGSADGKQEKEGTEADSLSEDAEKVQKKRTISADSVGSADDEKKSVDTEKEKDKVEKEEELPQLHRTSSVFLRNIAPSITKAEIDVLCNKHAGFLRTALADPQPERRWFRRGWVSFKRNVNIKEICWQLNNVRMKDSELGAIINRDLQRRVRTVNGITPHKTIVRNDIRLASQVIQFLDSKWNLWEEDPEADKKESFGVYSTNPVLKNITDYLIEEASAEEEELLAMGGGSDGELDGDGGDKGNSIERDEELIQVLDRLVLYLRFVHSLDYYNHAEYPYEDDMPNRLGILHGRGIPPASSVMLNELQEYNRNFEQKISTFCQKTETLSENECRALGMKEEEIEIEKFITANTQELGVDKWLCPLSGKKFKGPEFVRKHIQNKHAEKLEEVKKEVAFFNNYLSDPKRPKSPDRKDAGQASGGDRGFQRREPLMPDRGGDYPPPPFNPYGGGGGYGPGGPGYGGNYGGPPRYYGGGGGGYNGPPRGRSDYRGRGGNRPIISYRDLDAPPDMDDI